MTQYIIGFVCCWGILGAFHLLSCRFGWDEYNWSSWVLALPVEIVIIIISPLHKPYHTIRDTFRHVFRPFTQEQLEKILKYNDDIYGEKSIRKQHLIGDLYMLSFSSKKPKFLGDFILARVKAQKGA